MLNGISLAGAGFLLAFGTERLRLRNTHKHKKAIASLPMLKVDLSIVGHYREYDRNFANPEWL